MVLRLFAFIALISQERQFLTLKSLILRNLPKLTLFILLESFHLENFVGGIKCCKETANAKRDLFLDDLEGLSGGLVTFAPFNLGYT